MKKDGSWKKEGDIVHNMKLAVTLERLANGGPSEYYNGSLANDIVADIQDRGNYYNLEDGKDKQRLIQHLVMHSMHKYMFCVSPT